MSHSHPKQKVGILTLPLDHNYGGILQCIALQETLFQLGCETLLLDRRTLVSPVKKVLKNLLFGRAFSHIEKFKNTHIRSSSEPMYTSDRVSQLVLENKLNTIVVGSDQVWRERFVNEAFLDYFLHFIKDVSIVKIAYAASFGSATITVPTHTAEISEALQSFNAISVREDTAKTILNQTFGIAGAVQALDPTLLLSRTFYETLARNNTDSASSDNYLFSYLLDKKPSTLAYVNVAAATLNLPFKVVYGQLTGYFNRIFRKKVSVENWLFHFQKASFVVTDSYHGMLFSIIFEKQFVVLVNEKRGATRFESLARQLGLEDRLIKNVAYNKEVSWNTEAIDYQLVRSRLATLKEQSLAFLKNNLK